MRYASFIFLGWALCWGVALQRTLTYEEIDIGIKPSTNSGWNAEA